MSMLGSSLDVNHAFVLRSGVGTPLRGGGGGGGGEEDHRFSPYMVTLLLLLIGHILHCTIPLLLARHTINNVALYTS